MLSLLALPVGFGGIVSLLSRYTTAVGDSLLRVAWENKDDDL